MTKIRPSKAFTLIELLIVIAIIAIIAGAVLVAINPAKRLAQANDSRRYSEVRSILAAVNTYIVDNKGDVPDCTGTGDLPADGIWRWVGDGSGETFEGGTWLLSSDYNDSSGNDNHGSAQGSGHTFPYDNERLSNVLSLDGNGYMLVNHDPTLSINEDFSFMGWANPSSIITDMHIITKGALVGDSYQFYLYGTWKFAFDYYSDGDWRGVVSPDNILEAGIWSHLVVTMNKDGDIKLYENGEMVKARNRTYLIEASTEDVGIGARSGGNAKFNGRLFNLAIFDYELSESDVEAFYDNGQGRILNGSQTCDLSDDLVTTGGYLSQIPQDPSEGNVNNSGYLIKRDPAGTISVRAPHASDYAEQEILVSR